MAEGVFGVTQGRICFFLWRAGPVESLPQFPLPTHKALKKGVTLCMNLRYCMLAIQKYLHLLRWIILSSWHGQIQLQSADNHSRRGSQFRMRSGQVVSENFCAVRQCILRPSNVNNQGNLLTTFLGNLIEDMISESSKQSAFSDIVDELEGPNFDLNFRKLTIARQIYCTKQHQLCFISLLSEYYINTTPM
ncbi:UNVERIFIED_CONTAM: hypothetical protein Slati_4301500 [Sesamum latifolium]|uniref:Uncharacterized protein n=1 Tax=Sesamum latifolium TaxID=2727402 RepID=A0AAW2TGB6_9LAMI